MSIYPYQIVEKALDTFFLERPNELLLRRSYRRFKAFVFMLATVEYEMLDGESEEQREEALSFAWEDMDLAFRGYGDNCATGFVMQLWAVLFKEDWPNFKKALEECLGEARAVANEKGVKPRYSAKYLSKPVRDLDEEFCLPTALPLSGPVIREWAIENDKDPDRLEEAMLYLETVDRLREKAKAANDSEQARTKFEVLQGGKVDAE